MVMRCSSLMAKSRALVISKNRIRCTSLQLFKNSSKVVKTLNAPSKKLIHTTSVLKNCRPQQVPQMAQWTICATSKQIKTKTRLMEKWTSSAKKFLTGRRSNHSHKIVTFRTVTWTVKSMTSSWKEKSVKALRAKAILCLKAPPSTTRSPDKKQTWQ